MEVVGILGGLSLVELVIFSFIGANLTLSCVFLLQCGAKRMTVNDK